MDTARTILAGLLLATGVGICLINYAIVLHAFLRGTHASMLPLLGTMFMVLGVQLAPWVGEFPGVFLCTLLLFDLSGLPSLLLLPIYLLTHAGGRKEAPAQPQPAKALCVLLYMLLAGGWVLNEGMKWWPGE